MQISSHLSMPARLFLRRAAIYGVYISHLDGQTGPYRLPTVCIGDHKINI